MEVSLFSDPALLQLYDKFYPVLQDIDAHLSMLVTVEIPLICVVVIFWITFREFFR